MASVTPLWLLGPRLQETVTVAPGTTTPPESLIVIVAFAAWPEGAIAMSKTYITYPPGVGVGISVGVGVRVGVDVGVGVGGEVEVAVGVGVGVFVGVVVGVGVGPPPMTRALTEMRASPPFTLVPMYGIYIRLPGQAVEDTSR